MVIVKHHHSSTDEDDDNDGDPRKHSVYSLLVCVCVMQFVKLALDVQLISATVLVAAVTRFPHIVCPLSYLLSPILTCVD